MRSPDELIVFGGLRDGAAAGRMPSAAHFLEAADEWDEIAEEFEQADETVVAERARVRARGIREALAERDAEKLLVIARDDCIPARSIRSLASSLRVIRRALPRRPRSRARRGRRTARTSRGSPGRQGDDDPEHDLARRLLLDRAREVE